MLGYTGIPNLFQRPVTTGLEEGRQIRWSTLRAHLIAILDQYPEARQAVAESLASELGLRDDTEVTL
jgi:hypothetical protein